MLSKVITFIAEFELRQRLLLFLILGSDETCEMVSKGLELLANGSHNFDVSLMT